MIQQDEINTLDSIRDMVLKFGERFPKKHGNWICLKIENEFYSMDSWNGAIWHHQGKPKYEYWTGFTGSSSTYLGLSDRAWRHDDPLPRQKSSYIEHLRKINIFVNDHLIKKESDDSV